MIIMGHGAVTMLECQVEMLVSHSTLRFGHNKWIARAEVFYCRQFGPSDRSEQDVLGAWPLYAYRIWNR